MKTLLTALAGVAILFGTPQPAPAQDDPPAYETQEVAPGVHAFRHGFHRSIFIVTEEGVIATDPLGVEAAPIQLQEIRKVTDRPVKYLVYSHEHWDHIAGGTVLKEEGALIVAQENCLGDFARLPNPDVPAPDITFKDRHDITLGGRTLELYHFGLSHGSCMSVMRLADADLLFVVDIVTPGRVGFMGLPDTYPKQNIEYLKAVERLDFETVVPGHGPTTAPASTVTDYRIFFEDMDRAVEEAYAETGNWYTVVPIAKEALRPKYGDWNMFEQWIAMNLGRFVLEKRIGW